MKELIYQPRISGRAEPLLREKLTCILREAGLDKRVSQQEYFPLLAFADLRLDSVTSVLNCNRHNAARQATLLRCEHDAHSAKNPILHTYYGRINLMVINTVMESRRPRPSKVLVWAGF